ncbi:hypothetical protein SPRG_02868 [Saprolegnia parasitica CBS 223.65]|uniref:Metaxin glutathione S-transferase domain-containing protein n=1 Tax=Saprolegnia parasitica (strain CBS 223.65) TaxID=695850 RepID=A0A067D0U6_SAPPC|nr:hypothetical protein SPRG_02868 [Saprolegnia parasitica CBS 223.65]KDO32391.1 hypothetical protein SPRG_02868 [Saprolegnia parasitica CBS 223.65]|eukprot:XP_012196845.1 hypothetical protein SPRG_02868 [Saprolegnia parasitica CBS 223.65]
MMDHGDLDLSFPNRNSTLVPTERSLIADRKANMESLRVPPKTSAELGPGCQPTLHQFLPAYDVQAYVRFAKIPLHIKNAKYPSFEATGELPQLRDGHYLLAKDDIIMHLQTYHTDIDGHLSAVQKGESLAFKSMVQEKLQRVLHYCRWVDPITYKEVTRPAVQRVLPFPLNRVLPKKMHHAMTSELATAGYASQEQVYVAARDCYAALNARLGDGPFFYGAAPTSLDAIVFGHLVDALSDVQLRDVVHIHGPRLLSFAETVRSTYFGSKAMGSLWTENVPSPFLTLATAFMGDFATVPLAAYVQPYQSLSWSKREVAKEEVVHEVPHDDPAQHVVYDKSSRNVLFGGLLAIVLYGLSQLSFSIESFADAYDDDEYDEFEDGYDEDDA